jgi:hypothetical protein
MIHGFASLRRVPDAQEVPERDRERILRRRPLADGGRPALHDPLKPRARSGSSDAIPDVVGRAVWESAARARQLGATISLEADDGHLDEVHRDWPVWLAALGVSAIVLFLISLE